MDNRHEAVPEKAELLPPELAHGALGEGLPAAKDLAHLRDVGEVLLQCGRVHQSVVDIQERAPA